MKPLRMIGLPAELRQQIKEARRSRNLSQRELGHQIGLSQPHVSAVESGKIAPRFATLIDILRTLNLDLLLVPRPLVPAVHSLIRAHTQPESDERPLYAVDEDSE